MGTLPVFNDTSFKTKFVYPPVTPRTLEQCELRISFSTNQDEIAWLSEQRTQIQKEQYPKSCFNEAATIVNWRPIESAPKGQSVLVACSSGKITILWIFQSAKLLGDTWVDDFGNSLKELGLNPRWWAMLPQYPPQLSPLESCLYEIEQRYAELNKVERQKFLETRLKQLLEES